MRALIDALQPWIDTAELEASLPASPRRVVLIGRTSSGKTTLLNQLTGATFATGLGGVTRAVVEVNDTSVCWIDTPGIDSAARAINTLGPVIDRAHGVIWVVDGLQPLTHTEREVVRTLVPEGLPLKVVVSKADLIEEEVGSVVRRIEAAYPVSVRSLALRREPDLGGLRSFPPTAVEQRAYGAARAAAERALRGCTAPVDPEFFREAVDLRPAIQAVIAELSRRELNLPDLLLEFRSRMEDVRSSAIIRWSADPLLAPYIPSLPELPRAPDPTSDALEVLRFGAAGAANTLRSLRSLAGRWLMEVQLCIADWEVPIDAVRARAYAHATQALHQLPRELP